MIAVITCSLNSGLGDTYSGIYRVFDVQEELKKIGYNVKVIFEFGNNPYNTDGKSVSVYKKLFNLTIFDDLELVQYGLDEINKNYSSKLTKVFNYEHIYTIFVDTKSKNFDTIRHIKHTWYFRDDLPKINLLSNDITDFAEKKYIELGNPTIGLHFRPGDTILNNDNLKPHLNDINSENFISKEDKQKKIFLSTNKQIIKEYFSNKIEEYFYFVINKTIFPEVHENIKAMNLTDDSHYILMREILSEMYILSKCEKIYRICPWFSGFLFFTCTFNQTNISNTKRFIPQHPIIY